MKKVVGKLPPFAKNAHRCQAYKSMLHVPIYDEKKKFSEVSIPLSSHESIHMQHLFSENSIMGLLLHILDKNFVKVSILQKRVDFTNFFVEMISRWIHSFFL